MVVAVVVAVAVMVVVRSEHSQHSQSVNAVSGDDENRTCHGDSDNIVQSAKCCVWCTLTGRPSARTRERDHELSVHGWL